MIANKYATKFFAMKFTIFAPQILILNSKSLNLNTT